MPLFAQLTAAFAVCFLLTSDLSAQRLDHAQGRIIAQLERGTSPAQIQRQATELGWDAAEFRVIRRVSAPLNAYTFHFDYTQLDERVVRRRMQSMAGLRNVQFDHFVKLRNTPNDAQYPSQWQFLNIGQSGGLVGADLDMELAWDITTGGVTAAGDTIVLCVVDDGLEPGHQDFGDNIFVNTAEIPGNGIDDDNNGFVDDYQGWNTGSQNDDIDDINSHGTPVAGIMAAQGNNEIGVAGVNWDAKLMIVVGGTGVESEVLEAYSYPLTFRQKYNETDGAEGAFVVVTNSSWGVNFGDPAEAPLWCAMYDSLGTAGILSCGATANLNVDVDVDNDLPTACASEYLISVTNMNDDDVKVSGAGYGLTTVDLGAFGAGTYTTATPNTYDGFGGTSGATPHVAGAIGLLYSAPCPSLITLAKSDPAAAARQVRDYIFDGVEPNASLDTITTTGGRLNVYNSLSLLVQQCGGCIPPSSVSVSEITDVQAQVTWNVNDSLESVTFEYRPLGTTAWTTVADAASPLALVDLTGCTDYEFRISGACNTESSDYVTGSFKTDGCCENPGAIQVADVTLNSFVVTWNPVLAATGYNFRYRALGAADWITQTYTNTSAVIQGLDVCTDYEFQLRTNCAAETIDYTASFNLITKGCGACTDLDYCETAGGSTADEWVEVVAVGDWQSQTGDNDGYLDGTNLPGAELAQGGRYPLELIPGFTSTPYNERWRVWIDFNQDGNFSASTEQVFANTSGTSEAIADSIDIPLDALLGITRMRIAMRFNQPAGACADSYNFGEVEDYCVNITEATIGCPTPANFGLVENSETSVELGWEAINGASNYVLQYRLTSATAWNTVLTEETSYLIENLADCDSLIGQVRTTCPGAAQSDFSPILFFGTACSTGLDEWTGGESLRVFPNPATDFIRIELDAPNGNHADWELSVVDVNGRAQLPVRTVRPSAPGQLRTELPTNRLAPGVYFLRIGSAGTAGVRTERFLVVR